MTQADKKMNPQYFGTNPADIRILIQIDPEIRIWIPDHILALAEFAVSECSCLTIIIIITSASVELTQTRHLHSK